MIALYVIGGFALFIFVLWLLPNSRAVPYVQPVPPTLVSVDAAIYTSTTAGLKTLTLTAYAGVGMKKVDGMKAIRLICPQHDLLAAEYAVNHMPRAIATGLLAAQADDLAGKLQAAGFTVTVS